MDHPGIRTVLHPPQGNDNTDGLDDRYAVPQADTVGAAKRGDGTGWESNAGRQPYPRIYVPGKLLLHGRRQRPGLARLALLGSGARTFHRRGSYAHLEVDR